MSRSPLVAWRKLFAIGGAPAASHQVLSRAPSTDRLLEPLAGARVLNADRLEALTKPLDIGGALSRVTVTTTDARKSDVPDAKDRRSRAERVADVVHDVRTAREPLVARAPATRARQAASISGENEAHHTRLVPNVAAQPARARLMAPATPSTVRSKPVARFSDVLQQSHTPRPFITADPANDATHRTIASPATVSGANARVIVTSAVAEIDRLLAIGSPTTVAANANSNAARAPRTDTRAVESSARNASYLLADAVDRARAATAASGATPTDESRFVAHQTFAATPEPSRSVDHAPATTDAVGGFRGLAQRTLIPARSARRAPSQGIEAEKNVSNDLTLDTLDSRVADSLARVLEREARRHGIDLAEARA